MIKRLVFVSLLTIGALLWQVHSGWTQDTPELPAVGFVTDLSAATIDDTGEAGIARLSTIFVQNGASIETLSLEDPVPSNIDVVVIVRPRATFSAIQLGHLIAFLERGGNLLLATDPNTQSGLRTETQNGALSSILSTDFALTLQDTFITETWFERENSFEEARSAVITQPAAFSVSTVVEPLLRYDMTVQTWGARSIIVEPLSFNLGTGTPLLQTESAFGERTLNTLAANRNEPLEYNIGPDDIGQLNIAALGVNILTGSRIALLGDSSLLTNGFGLATIDGDLNRPISPGNYLLTERLAGWLLNAEPVTWTSTLNGVTTIAIDGDDADWPEGLSVQVPESNTSSQSAFAIESLRTFRNADYLYMVVETATATSDFKRLRITFDSDVDGINDMELIADDARLFATNIPDNEIDVLAGDYVADTAIELKIPLFEISPIPVVTQVCIQIPLDAGQFTDIDCLDLTVQPDVLSEIDSSTPYVIDNPLAILNIDQSVNLRAQPALTADRIRLLNPSDILVVNGISEDLEWLQVQTAAYEGWISAELVNLNTTLDQLPVITIPEDDQTPLPAFFGVISSSEVTNIRTAPQVDSAVITLQGDGTPLTLIGRSEDNEWLLVHGTDFIGWVATFLVVPERPIGELGVARLSELVVPETTGQTSGAEFQLLATIQTGATVANVREAPSASATIITTAARGLTVGAIGRNEDSTWILIQTPQFTGWVSASLIALDGDIDELPVVGETSGSEASGVTATPSINVDTSECESLLPSRLGTVARARVIPQLGISFREEPTTSGELIFFIPVNATVDVVGGPVCTDSLLWWQIRTSTGEIGWAAEGDQINYYLEPIIN